VGDAVEIALGLLIAVASAGVTLGVVGHYVQVRDMARQRDDARAESARLAAEVASVKELMHSSKWSDWLRYQRRQEAESLTLLLANSARDSLDALGRMSPDAARALWDEFAPHLRKDKP
jgi:hypothetical protein